MKVTSFKAILDADDRRRKLKEELHIAAEELDGLWDCPGMGITRESLVVAVRNAIRELHGREQIGGEG